MPAAGLEGHNYRLATDAAGNHGYEVGYWTAGEDPRYVVVARCYDQQEAARLVNQFNAEPPPDHLPPDESGEGSTRKTRTQLEHMTKDELIAHADDEDIDVPAHATKHDIIDAIVRHQRK
jgi:hypothetical protein